ncbi:NmrA-like family protein [Pleurostoma richardsiae]|uniref:NmrA-like family protein n=1 Tax=Pleurostoma richardsiae TaxID=41990 RepID=A0AA38VVL8_9PEZI|nr:NmrA-like family protein [Pleurostoma richardsiae]
MATYLVLQASGQQSGWTITHLLEAGAKVHALVRNPQVTPPGLERPGVTVFNGETTDFEAVFRAAQGCKGVFLNTFPIPGLEAQQAQTAVDACKKAGVGTIVVTTTFSTGDRAKWDDAVTKECYLHGYYSSKAAVEDIVRGAGFRAYTILRPAFMCFDYLLPGAYGNYPELPTHGELRHCFNDGVRMPHTDGYDVGKYAAAALQDPAKFDGQEIELGNEYLTVEEVRDTLVKVSGRDVRVRKRTPAEIREALATAFGQTFQLWANVKDFSGVTSGAKEVQLKFGIPFTSLEMALQRDKARLLECLPA